MTTDEAEIIDYLKQNPDSFFSRKEISKRARRREDYEANPSWATAPLQALLNQELIFQNEGGHYGLKTEGSDGSRW